MGVDVSRLSGSIVSWADDVLEGLVGGGQAVAGLASDFITAPFNSPETFDGTSDAVIDRLQVRFAELGEDAFGPDTGFGAVARVLPQPVRTFTGGAVGALETVGREAVREPLSTGFILANELSHGRGADVQRAYDLAQSVSAGQSLVTLLAGVDIHNPDEVARFVGTDMFRWTSGTADAALRMFADADVVLGHAASAARLKYLARPIRGGQVARGFFDPSVESALARGSRRALGATFDQVDDWIVSLPADLPTRAGTIRRRLFQEGDVFGDMKATLLARAPDKVTRRHVWEFLMGSDVGAMKKISEHADELAATIGDVRRMMDSTGGVGLPTSRRAQMTLADTPEWAAAKSVERQMVDVLRKRGTVNTQPDEWWRSFGDHLIDNAPDGLDGIAADLHLLQAEKQWVDRLQQAFKSQEFEPRLSIPQRISDTSAFTSFYQSPAGKPFRLVTEMLPHHRVDLGDTTTADVHLSRMLQAARMDPTEIDSWVGAMADPTTTRASRLQIWNDAQDAAIASLGREFDLPDDIVRLVQSRADIGRNAAHNHINDVQSRAYTPDGKSLMLWDDDGVLSATVVPKDMPLLRTQVQQVVTPPDFTTLRVHLRRLQADGLIDGIRDTIAKNVDIDEQVAALRRQLDDPDLGPDGIKAIREQIKEVEGGRVKVTGKTLQGSGPRTAFRQYGGYAKEIAESITYFWRPTVLMRVGWPLRVLTDEHLRMIAKFGLSDVIHASQGKLGRLGRQYARTLGIDDAYSMLKRQREGLTAADAVETAAEKAARYGQVRNIGTAAGAALGFGLAGPVGAIAGAGAGWASIRRLASLDDIGYGTVKLANGYTVASPFDQAGYYRDMVSMDTNFRELIDPAESGIARRFANMQGQWGTVTGDMPNHGQAWKRAVGQQYLQDPLGRMAIEGRTSAEMVAWLDTADGLRYLQDIPWRSSGRAKIRDDAGRWVQQTPEGWVDAIRMEASALTKADPEVARLLLDGQTGKAYDRLRDVIGGNVSEMPHVNGEMVAQMFGRSDALAAIEGAIDKTMRMLGTLPADTLTRQPTFALFYQREMTRLLDGIDPDDLDLGRLLDGTHPFAAAARKKALAQTRNLLYDLAERSAFGEMARGWMMPFFDAGREVLTRWLGLAWEKPYILAYARKAWEAPEKAGLVVEDEETGEQHLVFRVPESFRWMVNLPGSPLRGATDTLGRVAISRGALAPLDIEGGSTGILTGGLFGFGPVAQIGASQLVSRMPELEDSLKFLLPYGPTDPLRALSPAWVRRVIDMRGDPQENRAFRSIYGRILTTKMVEVETGETTADELRSWLGDVADGYTDEQILGLDGPELQSAFLAAAEDESRKLFMLRTYANFIMPASPQFTSPYQPLIDDYRRIIEELPAINEQRAAQGLEPTTADMLFIDKHGQEFYAITQGFTRSVDGVPPNLAAFDQRERFEGLINGLENKELAGLVVGVDGASATAEFSQAVYTHQLGTAVGPGASEAQREPLAGEDILAGPDVRLGWVKYGRLMDALEAERIARGLPNLQVKEAADLAARKRQAVAVLEQLHPLWARERAERDEGKAEAMVRDFRRLVADDRLVASRPEFQGLRAYLSLRDQMVAVLARLKASGQSSDLTSSENVPLRTAWETAVAQLRQSNPAFARLANRWLDLDIPSVDTAGL